MASPIEIKNRCLAIVKFRLALDADNESVTEKKGGLPTGAVIGYSSACARCDGDWRPLGAIGGGVLGGLTGLLAGILVGAPHHGFWQAVP